MICLKCAGAHRGLGVHVSYVRSLPLDSWTRYVPSLRSTHALTHSLTHRALHRKQIRMMNHSCNEKMIKSFENAGVPFRSLNIKKRYNTNVAKAYREQLEKYCKKTKRKKPFTPKLPRYDPESLLLTNRDEKARLDRVFHNNGRESNFERIRRQQQGKDDNFCVLL